MSRAPIRVWLAGVVLALAVLTVAGAIVVVSSGTRHTPSSRTGSTSATGTATRAATPAGTILTAAAAFGWGEPLPGSDEFNYTGPPDPKKWQNAGECWPGSGGHGRRCGSHARVEGGFLREYGSANGDTGLVSSLTALKGGRWEARVRLGIDGPTGHPYHPVLLTWPQSERWPQSGEYDFFEVDIGDNAATAFVHFPANTVVQEQFTSPRVDLTQWHTYALQWDARARTLTGYLDGQVWWVERKPRAQAPEPMYGTIQLDNNFGSGMQPAHMDVDFYRIYAAP